MTVKPERSAMSLEDYFHLQESDPVNRYEFIDGQVTQVPREAQSHTTISVNLARILQNALSGRPCLVFDMHTRIRLNRSRYVYADLAVSCHSQDRGRVTTLHAPCLVGEIISPETVTRDRNEKFIGYRDHASIQEYLLISADHPQIEVFRREGKNSWSYIIYHERDIVDLLRLMVHFPVSDLYKNVFFPIHK